VNTNNFSLMVFGQIVTVLGSSLLRFALSLYVLDITGRADIFAALFAISSIPILLSPVGGAISDRFNRQRLMVLYDFVCCAITLAFLLVMISGLASVFLIGTVMVLLGVVSAMETPNGAACIPLLVESHELEGANGIVQGVQALSGVAAPILGGILYGAMGIRVLVAVSCTAFALAAIMEMFIEIPFAKREQHGGIITTIAHDLKEGFSYVVKQPFILKTIILAALLNLLLSPLFIVGAPIILRMTMQSSDTVYGAGMGLLELATILGALSLGLFAPKMSIKNLYRPVAMIALLLLPMALSVFPLVLGLGFWPPVIIFMLGGIPITMAATIISIFVITKVQKRTPNENLGKVMAIAMAVSQCVAPVGQLLYGILFERFSAAVYIPILFMSAAMFVLVFVTRRILRNEEDAPNA
jgi:MFS family permease